MRLCRIYIKPDAAKWFDLPLRPDQDLGVVFSAMRREGALVLPSSFAVPIEQVHHLELLDVLDPPNAPPVWTPEKGQPN